MTELLFGLAAFLALTLAGGLVRVARGPTAADTMLAGQLFATTGVGIVLLLGEAMELPGARDVALALALLGAVAAVAFVRSGARDADPEP